MFLEKKKVAIATFSYTNESFQTPMRRGNVTPIILKLETLSGLADI